MNFQELKSIGFTSLSHRHDFELNKGIPYLEYKKKEKEGKQERGKYLFFSTEHEKIRYSFC